MGTDYRIGSAWVWGVGRVFPEEGNWGWALKDKPECARHKGGRKG